MTGTAVGKTHVHGRAGRVPAEERIRAVGSDMPYRRSASLPPARDAAGQPHQPLHRLTRTTTDVQEHEAEAAAAGGTEGPPQGVLQVTSLDKIQVTSLYC